MDRLWDICVGHNKSLMNITREMRFLRSLTEAFPAVTVPFSLKMGGRLAIFSRVTSLGCSSDVNCSSFPFFPFTSTVVSSDEK